jgi:hypothetical protein
MNDPYDRMSYCHHLVFVTRRQPLVFHIKKSSPLQLLNQIKPILAVMVISKIVSDSLLSFQMVVLQKYKFH